MRHCPICGADMSHRRSDAFVCGAACRAELSRVRRLLAGQPADGRESLQDHIKAKRGAQARAKWPDKPPASVALDPRQARRWKAGKAKRAVADAIQEGKLERQPCEVCGAPKTHGHHDDYDKPLEVRWLCPAHHHDHHRNERAIGATDGAAA